MSLQHLKVPAILFSLFYLLPAPASACVSFIEKGNTSQTALWGEFQNNCPYRVVIRGRADNGYEGLWGPLAPGRSSVVNPGVDRYRISFVWCNYDAHSGCIPGYPEWP